MCPPSIRKGKLPGHAEPSRARQVGYWLWKRERGAVSYWNLTCSTLGSRGSCWGTRAQNTFASPDQRGQAPRDCRCVQGWTIPGASWAGGEKELSQPSVPFLNAGSLCLLSASIQEIQQLRGLKFTLWGDLCLPSTEKCFFAEDSIIWLTSVVTAIGAAQIGCRFGCGRDEKIKGTRFEQLAH